MASLALIFLASGSYSPIVRLIGSPTPARFARGRDERPTAGRLDLTGGCARVGAGLGGDAMKRRDDTPQIIILAALLCAAMALGAWFYEVWHG